MSYDNSSVDASHNLKSNNQPDEKLAQNLPGEDLPPLTAKEFRGYNRLAEEMNYYHTHFRMEWDQIYKACQTDDMSETVPASRIIRMGLQFVGHLTAHHNIEETYIFPALADKMPQFSHSELDPSNPKGPIQQHREIHAGLDKLQDYLHAARAGEIDFRREELKSILDSFKDVLWTHLDEEVALLGAESMRKYWTIDELRAIPM